MYGNLVALHILANHQMWLNGGFRLIEHMLTPPTHYFLESSGQVVYMESHPYSWRTLTPPPPTNFSGEEYLGKGNCPARKSRLSGPNRKLLHARLPACLISKKYHCPCILEGHLFTNPILNALRLQGPNLIYMFTSIE